MAAIYLQSDREMLQYWKTWKNNKFVKIIKTTVEEEALCESYTIRYRFRKR